MWRKDGQDRGGWRRQQSSTASTMMMETFNSELKVSIRWIEGFHQVLMETFNSPDGNLQFTWWKPSIHHDASKPKVFLISRMEETGSTTQRHRWLRCCTCATCRGWMQRCSDHWDGENGILLHIFFGVKRLKPSFRYSTGKKKRTTNRSPKNGFDRCLIRSISTQVVLHRRLVENSWKFSMFPLFLYGFTASTFCKQAQPTQMFYPNMMWMNPSATNSILCVPHDMLERLDVFLANHVNRIRVFSSMIWAMYTVFDPESGWYLFLFSSHRSLFVRVLDVYIYVCHL